MIDIYYEEFDPDLLDRKQMNYLADCIEDYLEVFLCLMIIPDELKADIEDDVKEGIKRTRKLIKKLRNGKASVFKDPEDVD